jgi:hypothetical protein
LFWSGCPEALHQMDSASRFDDGRSMATTHCVEAMWSDNVVGSQTLNKLEGVSGRV